MSLKKLYISNTTDNSLENVDLCEKLRSLTLNSGSNYNSTGRTISKEKLQKIGKLKNLEKLKIQALDNFELDSLKDLFEKNTFQKLKILKFNLIDCLQDDTIFHVTHRLADIL